MTTPSSSSKRDTPGSSWARTNSPLTAERGALGLGAPNGFTYRPWREGDDPACVDMLAPMGWTTAERYARKFEDEGLVPGSVLIAESAGEIRGHSITALRRLIFGDARLPAATIGQVVVRGDSRGRGVGRNLLEQALRFALRHGAVLVWLTAHPGRGVAYDMYRRRGFERVQHRLTARFSAKESTDGLSARRASPSDAAELRRLRRTFARLTGAVQDRDYEQALGWEWWIVSRGGRANAAVRIWTDLKPPTISAALFDADEDPAPYVNSAIRGAGLSEVDVRASPAAPLVARMPGLDWKMVSGENLAFVPSLSRLLTSLLPCYRRRAVELGIRTGRVAVERNDARIAVAFDRGEARISPPRPDDTRVVFPGEGIASAVLGASDPSTAVRDGAISVQDGAMPAAKALEWLFPYRYCDFTQHSAW